MAVQAFKKKVYAQVTLYCPVELQEMLAQNLIFSYQMLEEILRTQTRTLALSWFFQHQN